MLLLYLEVKWLGFLLNPQMFENNYLNKTKIIGI